MDMDAFHSGPHSEEERRRRRVQRLCFYCGEGGHLRSACPLLLHPASHRPFVSDNYYHNKPDYSTYTISSLHTPAPPTASHQIPEHSKFFVSGLLKFGTVACEQSFFVDSGADANFIDHRLVDLLAIPRVRLESPIPLQLADGSSSRSAPLEFETIPIQLHFGKHLETIVF
jgi:hypothetical protein